MKFKPIALVVIGILLGSTITLTLTRPSVSTAEILACTNKKSGKTRLTISDECNNKTESKSAVTDLWGLQRTTSPSTEPKALKKHVVDANGKDLGDLIEAQGLDFFWIDTTTGVWQVSADEEYVSAKLYTEYFSDAKCRRPYLYGDKQSSEEMMRAVVEVRRDLPKTRKKERVGFKTVGGLIKFPDVSYVLKGWGNDFLTCVPLNRKEADNWQEGGAPKFVYRSTQVSMPSYSPPLRIVEK
jgi:hypothetical protein